MKQTYFQYKKDRQKLSMKNTTSTEKTHQKRAFSTVKTMKKIEKQTQQKFKYYIGNGNNPEIIRRVLSTRKHWEQVTDPKYMFTNLKWYQTNKNYKYQNCVDNKIFRQSLNHFEFHTQLSNKESMFKNLQEYCQSQKLNVFDIVPLTFIINLSDSNFQQAQMNFLRTFDSNLPQNMKTQGRKQYLLLKRRRSGTYGRYQLKGSTYYSKNQIHQAYRDQNSDYLWILKPTSQNRGHGIHVFNSLQNLQDLMNHYLSGETSLNSQKSTQIISQTTPLSPQSKKKSFRIRQYLNPALHQPKIVTSFVIQKYLQRPLLYDNRKFDVRVWVLINHEHKVYLFKQGYMRTSSYKYSTNKQEIQDLNIHLTNNAVQKNNKDYGKFQDGNQLSFRVLKTLIESYGKKFSQVLSQMKRIIKMTALSVRKKVNKNQRAWCFQIFGYDFMYDTDCKPWLIQVNTNPCLEQSSILLQNLIPRMLDDAFMLTIDKMFESQKSTYNYSLQNQMSTDNLWQFLIDLKKTGNTTL